MMMIPESVLRYQEKHLRALKDVCRTKAALTGLKLNSIGLERKLVFVEYAPKTTAHVFSKARDVSVDSRKSFSDMGFFDRP